VWAPTGVVDIHLPEYWGYVQFSTSKPHTTLPVKDPDWTIRYIAMQMYYAQVIFSGAHNGTFASEVDLLVQFAAPHTLDGTCTQIPEITLSDNGLDYTAFVTALGGNPRVASVNNMRYLVVTNSTSDL